MALDRPSAKSTVRWTSGTNVLAGIWLVLAPFALAYTAVTEALWNDVIIGAAVFVLALVRVGKPLEFEGISWTNVVLGAWLIIAPFTLGYASTAAALWNDIILGIIVAGLALWSGYTSKDLTPQMGGPEGEHTRMGN